MSKPATRVADCALDTVHFEVIIAGGGQAGLSLSHYLKQGGIQHIVFEKRAVMHAAVGDVLPRHPQLAV